MFTLEILEKTPNHTVFQHGIIKNSPDGIYMTNSNFNEDLIWVAVKGGAPFWSVYVDWLSKYDVKDYNIPQSVLKHISNYGQKVGDMNNLKKLFKFDETMQGRYNF